MSHDAGKPTPGLFSKVMHMVRGKADGAQAAVLEDELPLDSRQDLRETMERKRRNDSVRLQEFAQLRQLRQQGGQDQPKAIAPVVSVLPSEQENTLQSTQTLRKIDVIEAQMSSQWWGNGPAASADPLSTAEQPAHESPSMPTARPAAAPVQERRSVEFQPHPDLEEPAIFFAHGDADAARTRLLEHLAQVLGTTPVDTKQAAMLWHAALDLCRATGDEETFEPLAIDYAAHFGKSPPLWNSLPGQLGLPVGTRDSAVSQRKVQWQSPAGMGSGSVTALQAAISRAAQPWNMSWQRLQSIEENALPALTQLLHTWAENPGQFVWSHAGALLQLLERHTVVEDKESPPAWWLLRLAVLRFVHRMEEYDQVALDYCITYEVSPPAWQEPRHQCLVEEAGDADLSTLQDSSLLTGMASGLGASAQPDGAQAAAAPVLGDGLFGILEGDVQAHLDGLEAKLTPGQPLDVDCSLLIRLDFVAAGGLLNWAAHLQSQGHALRFTNLHQLTAAFLYVVGVHEHAKLMLRLA